MRTSIPDVGLSDLADPERLALVSAFRAEVAREVRAAEFSDPQGLVKGLSTGVLAALGKRPEGPPAGGPVLRLPPQVPFLAGREELLAELDDQLAEREGASSGLCAIARSLHRSTSPARDASSIHWVSWMSWELALPYRSSIVSRIQPACLSAMGTIRAPSPRSRKKRSPAAAASRATLKPPGGFARLLVRSGRS